MRGGGARRPRLHDVPAGMLMLRRPKVVRRPRSAAALSRPDRSRHCRYMTSVPFVALIVWVPDDVQLLLNVEPPVKVIVSAISWVHW